MGTITALQAENADLRRQLEQVQSKTTGGNSASAEFGSGSDGAVNAGNDAFGEGSDSPNPAGSDGPNTAGSNDVGEGGNGPATDSDVADVKPPPAMGELGDP
jgi:hypothetical protein